MKRRLPWTLHTYFPWGLVPWGASWSGAEPRCHPGMLGPQRASSMLLLSFLPVAWLENGKRSVGRGGHAAFKAVAHSLPPGRLHPTASLGLEFQGQQPHWDDPVTSGCPGEGWGCWMLGRPLLCVRLGGQVLRTDGHPLLAAPLQRASHPEVSFSSKIGNACGVWWDFKGGGSHLCWLCLPRFPQIHLGLHHTPLVSSLPLRMPLCRLQDWQQCPRMGPRHWCPWQAHPWGEGDSETLDEMPLEACWALQKEQGCVWGTGLAFCSFGGTKLFLWSL